MYSPDNYIAIVKSPLDSSGVTLLLEPIAPDGNEVTEVAKVYKKRLYELGVPVITFSSLDILKSFNELKEKGVVFKKDPKKTDYGIEAIFDDAHGNHIQLIQLD